MSPSARQLHSGLQLNKITKKNNHVLYNMRCWICFPHSSTHFWHLFRKYALTQINSISEIQSISRLILAFNSSNVWGGLRFLSMGHLKNKVYATNPHTLEKLKASIRREIDCISEIELTHVNAHFLTRCQKCVDEGGQHFQHLML